MAFTHKIKMVSLYFTVTKLISIVLCMDLILCGIPYCYPWLGNCIICMVSAKKKTILLIFQILCVLFLFWCWFVFFMSLFLFFPFFKAFLSPCYVPPLMRNSIIYFWNSYCLLTIFPFLSGLWVEEDEKQKCPNMHKSITYDVPTANFILNGEKN